MNIKNKNGGTRTKEMIWNCESNDFFFHIPQIQLLCDSNSMASLLARA